MNYLQFIKQILLYKINKLAPHNKLKMQGWVAGGPPCILIHGSRRKGMISFKLWLL